MFRGLRTLAAVLALAASLIIGAAPALAAVPANDLFAGATAVTALPFDAAVDTRDATTDATDTEANANCGAPATLASVWYDFTPGTDGGFVVDVSGSDYSAGVIVVSGSPGAFVLETCGPGSVAFFGTSGVDYHILAFSDTAGVNGGQLKFHMEAAPPPPVLTLTVDPVGHVNQRTGVATLSGTWSCTGVADFAEIDGDLSQSVGRFTIRGSFFVDAGPCDGTLKKWAGTVYPDSGKFAGGKGAAVVFTFACGPFFCSDGFAEQRVQLRR